MTDKDKLILIGAGGHAKVLVDSLLAQSCNITGLCDANFKTLGYYQVLGVPVLGDDDIVMGMDPASVRLICAIASVKSSSVRKQIIERFKRQGFKFVEVIHPSAIIGMDCSFGEGAQVMAGAILQPGSKFGKGVIVNTGARVDHDCYIGDYVHVAPNATICGDVEVDECSHIGSGATVLQGISIGRKCTVAAGAVVTKNVADNTTVMGVPATIEKVSEP